jgi:hypothetical protein
MVRILLLLAIVVLVSCKTEKKPELTAQDIIDSSIVVSGGDRYLNSIRSFSFRDRNYISENKNGKQVLKRILTNDTTNILDIRTNQKFERYVDDSLVQLHDTLAKKYANSVNSVHYFASLPFGLNDPAVHKELLGNVSVKGKEYLKIKVTFDQEGGGDDFEDTYVYWFNKKTWKPDYLAYEFQVDGGGMRFREAYNERYVNGIRFVDYDNYKTVDMETSILKVDSLFEKGNLEFLSKIELKDVQVNLGSYN